MTGDEELAKIREVFGRIQLLDNKSFRHGVYTSEAIYPWLRNMIEWRYLVQRDIDLRIIEK